MRFMTFQNDVLKLLPREGLKTVQLITKDHQANRSCTHRQQPAMLQRYHNAGLAAQMAAAPMLLQKLAVSTPLHMRSNAQHATH